MKKFIHLKFGTSGLRDTVGNMTDKECYINTRGFILFLKERGEIDEKNNTIALAGDLRSSTVRIMGAVVKAVEDEGCVIANCGPVPTPTMTNYALRKSLPGVMVTGSHIPDDRNGIKFTKKAGEVLKTDEADILRNVEKARETVSGTSQEDSLFDAGNMFKTPPNIPDVSHAATVAYIKRYTDVFSTGALFGKKVVLYQHSAVGRDILETIFKALGAEVIAVGRSDTFVPVDTEKVSAATTEMLKSSADEYRPFAVISTDGDSDRPLLADENGRFLTGDKLGALVSLYLKPDYAAVPISANDAVVSALGAKNVEVVQTRIGSPYVIAAMNEKLSSDPAAKVVSWESNGGFLLGSDWDISGKKLAALPTRDAVLPLIASMLLAISEEKSIAELIDSALPERYTHADVADDKTPGCETYTADMGKTIIKKFSPGDPGITQADFSHGEVKLTGAEATPQLADELMKIKNDLESHFNAEKGFADISSINFIDGIRIAFSNNDVAHIRPSGNAPEFRMYATADTEERADEIVDSRKTIIPEFIKEVS